MEKSSINIQAGYNIAKFRGKYNSGNKLQVNPVTKPFDHLYLRLTSRCKEVHAVRARFWERTEFPI